MPEKASSFFVNQLEKIYYQSKALSFMVILKMLSVTSLNIFGWKNFLINFLRIKDIR